MPLLFSRSSERKSKSTLRRFSLRKRHFLHSDVEPDAASTVNTSHSGHTDRRQRRQTQPSRAPEQTIVVPSILTNHTKSLQGHPFNLSSSVCSSTSTLRSTSATLHENLSGGENEMEISEISGEPETSDSPVTPPLSRSMRNSLLSASANLSSSHGSHKSLAEYRQLQCSMSYKNRINSDSFRATSTFQSSGGPNFLDARIAESSTTIASPVPLSVSPSIFSVATRDSKRLTSSAKATEASVAALQTRRAFQQMVLAMEDEDSGDEYDSDNDVWCNNSAENFQGHSDVVRLGADEYRKFQLRLRQLEELAAEQSRKQADMEQSIEQEVQAKTAKVIEAMEKQIGMYKQAKELECEREVQRRVSEHLENPRLSSRSPSQARTQRSSSYALRPSNSLSSFRESYNISTSIKEEGRSLEKLLHPRRSRKRLEQMKEREKAQKREMEQFREFIRTTEMRVVPAQGMNGVMSPEQLKSAKEKLDELADPLLLESLLHSSPSELIELVCVLRKDGYEQEKQIEEAKKLVTAAIEAREAAETMAREAVELTLMLDAKLDRAEREKKDLLLQARKLSAAVEHRHTRESRETYGRSTASSDWEYNLPASSMGE